MWEIFYPYISILLYSSCYNKEKDFESVGMILLSSHSRNLRNLRSLSNLRSFYINRNHRIFRLTKCAGPNL